MDLLRTTKPLVKSQLFSEIEAAHWERYNLLSQVYDGDDLKWTLEHYQKRVPDPEDPKISLYELGFIPRSVLSAEHLLKAHILTEKDERLLLLFGDARINLHLQPVIVRSHSQSEAKRQILEEAHRFQKRLQKKSFAQAKRRYVELWIEKDGEFAQRLPKEGGTSVD